MPVLHPGPLERARGCSESLPVRRVTVSGEATGNFNLLSVLCCAVTVTVTVLVRDSVHTA